MLKTIFALVVAFATSTVAMTEEKTVKLQGGIQCAKCELGVADSCASVIKVDDKVYYFDAAAHKKYHKECCKGIKQGTVTGEVKKDGDKMVITVKSLEFKK